MDDQRSLRLLAVEDEGLILLTLVDMLEDLGHTVTYEAANVSEAIAIIEEHAHELDGCILDANLDGQSAVFVANKLRQAKIPFVVASGYESRELIKSGLTERRIAKPYNMRELEVALQEFHQA